MNSISIDQKKLTISLEVLNSLLISLLEDTHDMADAQHVAHIITMLLTLKGEQE